MLYYLHSLADVRTYQMSLYTHIWQFIVILPGAEIDNDCNIYARCFIDNEDIIGDQGTVKSGAQLRDGLRVGDHVFIGPNVAVTNDKFPRSKQYASTIVMAAASFEGGGDVSWHNDWRACHGGGKLGRRPHGARRRHSLQQPGANRGVQS